MADDTTLATRIRSLAEPLAAAHDAGIVHREQPLDRRGFLGEALRVTGKDWAAALALYQKNRVPRTGRIVLSSREMGRIYHATGVERLIRNQMWKDRPQQRFYDAMEWLYSWNVSNCLQQG